MSVINSNKATRLALYRLVKVLRAEIETELATLNDTGNIISTPSADSYFVTGTEQEMNQILLANNSACFIYPLGPSTVTAPRTGDGTVRAKLHTTIIRVVFLFKKPAGYTTYSLEGKDLTLTEIMLHMTDRLMGAASDVIYKHAVNLTDIHEVNIISQYADVVTLNNNDLIGRAILEVEVLQDVLVPMPAYTIP